MYLYCTYCGVKAANNKAEYCYACGKKIIKTIVNMEGCSNYDEYLEQQKKKHRFFFWKRNR